MDALGGGSKRSAFAYTLASRAFHLMLDDYPGGYPSATRVLESPWSQAGFWAGDSVAIVGDDQIVPDWERFAKEFAEVDANAILVVFNIDGFRQLGEAAERDDSLFMEMCYLVSTRQALALEPHLRRVFGHKYLHRYKELRQQLVWFHPKNLAIPPGR
ncbi:MAG TPA: hypothetical protein VER17_11415 [Tepidisphaeraceae bacterium]|nr:hypothetical protein [Tepidisphaeraceae bacterium]